MGVGVGRFKQKQQNFSEIPTSSFLEALVSGARPMEIVASPELISVSNVFVLFHYLLWKAKLDFDCLEPKPRLVVY